MPISYVVDRQKGLITETWTGDVAAADLSAYWREYLKDPDVLAIRRTLVDLRQCTILFTGAQLSILVRGTVVPVVNGQDWKTAIVVDHPVQFGVSRQYQVFAESFSVDSIFEDPEAALAWLFA